VSGQLHAPAALPPEKELPVPMYRKLGGPQSHSGRGGEEKNSRPPGNRTPIVQPVATRYTELSWLLQMRNCRSDWADMQNFGVETSWISATRKTRRRWMGDVIEMNFLRELRGLFNNALLTSYVI
jgi:hypothetical protein